MAEKDDGADVEREDEQPTVVVLKAGDVGPEEYKTYRQHMKGVYVNFKLAIISLVP